MYGIMRYIDLSYTLEVNGVVQRKSQHILACVRALMFEMNVKKAFWEDVCHYVVTLIKWIQVIALKNRPSNELVFG